MASPHRSKTESMNAPSRLTLPVARASVPSNMSKTPPTNTTIPPTVQYPRRDQAGADDGDPEADEGQRVGRQPEPAQRQGDRLEDALDPVAGLVRDASTGDAQDGALARGDLAEGLGAERADGLAADAPGIDQAGHAQALEVVADERL